MILNSPILATRNFLILANLQSLATRNFQILEIQNLLILATRNFQTLVIQNFLSLVTQNSLSLVIQNFLVRMSTSSTVPTRSAPPARPTEMGCGRSPWPAVESIRSARSARSSTRPARSIPSAQPAHARKRGHPNLRYACRTKVHSPTVQIAQFKFYPADFKPFSPSSSQQISDRSVRILPSRSKTTQFKF